MVFLDPTKPKRKFKDLTGMKFHYLTVIRWAGRDQWRTHYYFCACDCGGSITTTARLLKEGRSKGCECCSRERHTKHGMVKTPEYLAWVEMKRRCTKYNRSTAHRYIGRGISVCNRWANSFENFFSDLGFKPTPKHSLERLDNDGRYEPGNVVWATIEQQVFNRCTTRRVTFNGKTLSLAGWAREVGMKHRAVLYFRLKKGWSIEKALISRCAK